MPIKLDKKKVLKTYFGHESFRDGQEQLIDMLLLGRDVLGVMPTGAGKSICYQLPAVMMSGITLVVSPLISLMQDQVESLIQSGIKGAFINSSLTSSQYQETLFHAASGQYKILYVAPERLLSEEFLSLCKTLTISMVAIDEAHCVSQWGQDFRPSYLKIKDFIRGLSIRPVVCAFTATATAQVKADIKNLLELNNPFEVTTGFDRHNLYLAVRTPAHKPGELMKILKERINESGIIYCATRKTVEEICVTLIESGIKATRYHAGLSPEERQQNQEDFLFDRKPVMVATNAFGMGIDKSNVTFVVHYNMPKNLESYYQEAGRAGRDGSPADCILLYSGSDVRTNLFLIDKSEPSRELSPEEVAVIKERERDRLRRMTFYCTTADCLRSYLLNYFGEKSGSYCGNCGNCQAGFEEIDITIETQKIMSCIAKTHQRFGIKMIIDILRGSKNQRLLNFGLNTQSTYGILKEFSEKKLRSIIDFLLSQGLLALSGQEYPILTLSPSSVMVLKGQRQIIMKFLLEKEQDNKQQSSLYGHGEIVDKELLGRLKNLRRTIAAKHKIPAYIVFTDASLTDMSIKKPRTLEEFLLVSGVGKAKQDKYGEIFLKEINKENK